MSMHFHSTRAAAVVAVLAATVVVVPSAASAQGGPMIVYADPGNVRTERVSFARLDLTKARDQKRLHHRVDAAIERVCLRDTARPGLQDAGYYGCASDAWDDAKPQIAEAVAKAGSLALNGGGPIAAIAIRVSAR